MECDEKCAECGAGGEAYAEGCADDAHSTCAILGGGDVADVGLGGGDISAADSVYESGAEDCEEGVERVDPVEVHD